MIQYLCVRLCQSCDDIGLEKRLVTTGFRFQADGAAASLPWRHGDDADAQPLQAERQNWNRWERLRHCNIL